MLNLKCISLSLNKLVVVLVTVSLLATTFICPVDENIKQDFSALCKATSIYEYYNSLAELSYGMINKMLKSANINIALMSTTKAEKTNNKKTNKTKNHFDFVQPNNENSYKNLITPNLSLANLLFSTDNFKFYQISNYTLANNIFILFVISLGFCYFARGNIDDNINFNNKKTENRLV